MRKRNILFLFLFLASLPATGAYAVNFNIIGSDDVVITEYYWTLEQDATHHVIPGAEDPDPLWKGFHTSYMPVLASGDETNPPSNLNLDPETRYFISVLPKDGYSNGGSAFDGSMTDVDVRCIKHPFPTAQITVFVFHDNAPLNNEPDLPQEQGLEGFSIVVEEAGGKYGQNGGMVMQDAWGNALGTTYQQDANGDFILDGEGNPVVDQMGDMIILTDANGMATVKYLPPGKFAIIVIPPTGQGWQQTSTIEGSKVVDAWVKANEPGYFQEFGPPGFHVFTGFIQNTVDTTVLNGTNIITGRVTNNHLSRHPETPFYSSEPFGHILPWIALNSPSGGVGECVYAAPANEDATFAIKDVPPGDYDLVIFDRYLDIIIATMAIQVDEGVGTLDLGDIPVFNWFTRLENYVFNDKNENGMMDPGEQGIPEQAVNVRWRDGTIYQSFPTDVTGFVPFDTLFPFFSWLVAEVDFARFKATGLTVVVDGGGEVDPNDPWTFGGQLNPQMQPDPFNKITLPYRVERGPVLTQGFQGFLGQTSVLLWGKKEYARGENGGISGMVFYAITRAEDDPRYAAAEPWEPGIPRVQMNLYADADDDSVIDDLNNDGQPTLADVDNWPFGNFPGPEDVDRNYQGQTPGVFNAGDAIQISYTDSWDDSIPTDCPGDPNSPFYFDAKCYDGMANWNQVRPAVFDGGFAFDSYYPGGIESGSQEAPMIKPGIYIVEAVPPPGYEIIKEEDRNVDFGDTYVPSEKALPPECVGDLHMVPNELTLFPGVECPAGGTMKPLADRKKVYHSDRQNTAVEFHFFTKAPIAGHIFGMILDDAANEFDPNSPQFGEKYAPPFMPISIRDWTGAEIGRTYSDRYGKYNAVVPSTFTVNQPIPSGMSPNMLTVALNDPGPIPNPDYDPQDPNSPEFITDPFFNRNYSQFSYTFQYMPGSTTYLDTPVLPVGAFVGPDQFPVDCAFIDGTPRIYSVNGPMGGPYVAQTGQYITIVSMGENFEVPNPAFDGTTGTDSTIMRDYGFGSVEGTVTINGVALTDVTWTADSITGMVPSGTTTGQLMVTRGDNSESTVVGVTVTVGGDTPTYVPQGGSIQDAIDMAQPGDTIMVPPGRYDELVIMWKPVKLQGYGAGSTIINAAKYPSEKLDNWRIKVNNIIDSGAVDLLPNQPTGIDFVEPALLFNEEGSGILVLSKNDTVANGGFGLSGGMPNARIDGFSVMGADHAGGIVLNGYAHYLQMTNNIISNNQGVYGGGIRVGHPTLIQETGNGLEYVDSQNDHLTIKYNHITGNSNLGGAGGGVALYTGCGFYLVSENYICGNFAAGQGGGIGQMGLSDRGIISYNDIIFNETFNQGATSAGGGIYIGGQAPIGENPLSPGAGTVKILSNRIQGNVAGAGDGGGIRVEFFNGQDVVPPATPYELNIFNNMIVNNVAAFRAGGISLQDSPNCNILHNTIAHNDSTATAGEAFAPGSPNMSSPQAAGLVTYGHTLALENQLTAKLPRQGKSKAVISPTFTDPLIANNIILQNRSFYFQVNPMLTPMQFSLVPNIDNGDPPVFTDLAVVGTGTPQLLNPENNLMTDPTGYDGSNFYTDPMFLQSYYVGSRSSVVLPEVTTGITPPPALDEGGNFIRLQLGPLSLTNPNTGVAYGDYHLQSSSSAINAGDIIQNIGFPDLAMDFDGDTRPIGPEVDLGADETAGVKKGPAKPPKSSSKRESKPGIDTKGVLK